MTDFEVYLKTKIAEVQNSANDEINSCTSDPNELAKIMQLKSKLLKQPYHHRGIDLISSHRSVTNDSKASVYYTPNESVDQSHQLQSSPMHINFIQENLNTYADCLKPEPRCKFDFNMHRLEENLEQEIDQRRRRHTILCANLGGGDYAADDDDETIDINSEQTRMLNQSCSKNDDGICGDDDIVNNLAQGYIPLNTLPKHSNKFKRTASGKDMYYSLENVFDVVSSGVVSNLYEMTVSDKTIDEASETQVTNSTSENSSLNNMSRLNAMTSESLEDNNDPTQSVLMSNGTAHLNDVPTSSNSMPNIISKMEQFSIECHDNDNDAAAAAADNNDDHINTNANATTATSITANDCC